MNVVGTGATGYLGAVAYEARDCQAVRAIQEAPTDYCGALSVSRRRNVA
jgi:hypothetical protein